MTTIVHLDLLTPKWLSPLHLCRYYSLHEDRGENDKSMFSGYRFCHNHEGKICNECLGQNRRVCWWSLWQGFHLRKDELKQMRVVVLFSCNLCLQGGVMSHFLPSWLVDCWVNCWVNWWVVSVITMKVNTKRNPNLFHWKNMWALSELLVR